MIIESKRPFTLYKDPASFQSRSRPPLATASHSTWRLCSFLREDDLFEFYPD